MLQAVSTSISAIYQSPIKMRQTDEAYFKAPFHFHPELELVHIIDGSGKRIIGHTLQEFHAGELLLIGPNVPHLWMSDQEFYAANSALRSRSVVLNFDASIFSQVFYAMEESFPVKTLFDKSKNGVLISGETRMRVIDQLADLLAAKSLDKIICLLNILKTLSLSTELKLIDQPGLSTSQASSGRLTHLFEYIADNLDKNITLQQAAGIANFTPPSFARFFKQKTGKTFMDYVQETRISCASKTLIETDSTVAEVAHSCGFQTVTTFNKWFKRVTGISPTTYRNNMKWPGLHTTYT